MKQSYGEYVSTLQMKKIEFWVINAAEQLGNHQNCASLLIFTISQPTGEKAYNNKRKRKQNIQPKTLKIEVYKVF